MPSVTDRPSPAGPRVLQRVRTFVRQPYARKMAVVEAAIHLVLAKLCILRRGQHAAILAYTNGRSSSSAAAVVGDGDAAARDVQWALRALDRWVPERNRCLVSALAASRMLSRRKLPWMMTISIGKRDDGLIAHASLRCGTRAVTGGHGARHVTPLATYHS